MPSRLMSALAAVLLLLTLAACSGDDSALPGRYAGATPEGPVSLELKDNGKGTWSTPDEDIAVAWELRSGEVWLHTKSGGVVVCAVQPDRTLSAKVPGVGQIILSRQRP
jgi:hypothetical protein